MGTAQGGKGWQEKEMQEPSSKQSLQGQSMPGLEPQARLHTLAFCRNLCSFSGMELCNNQTMDRCIPCEILIVLKSQSILCVELGQLPEACQRALTAGTGARRWSRALWPQPLPDRATSGKRTDSRWYPHESGGLGLCCRLVLTSPSAVGLGQQLTLPPCPSTCPSSPYGRCLPLVCCHHSD